jgi:hypothetical protein
VNPFLRVEDCLLGVYTLVGVEDLLGVDGGDFLFFPDGGGLPDLGLFGEVLNTNLMSTYDMDLAVHASTPHPPYVIHTLQGGRTG